MLKKFIFWLLRPRWIVEDDRSLGLRLCNLGLNLTYYKWPEPIIGTQPYRFAEKREFRGAETKGETIKTTSTFTGQQYYP